MSPRSWILILGVLISPIVVVCLVAGFIVVSVGGAISAGGDCRPVGSSSPQGGSLDVTQADGTKVTLQTSQLNNASTIIAVGKSLDVSDAGLTIALMTALQESGLRNYANSTVPESLDYPHEAVGSDHDSVNLFQQRANWGSVANRMDVTYAAKAFFGGPTGPNHGRPAGLLDIKDWEQLPPGEAAQSVQISAYPSAYDKWRSAAQEVLASVGRSECTTSSGSAVLPLDPGYPMTEDFGPRAGPIEGVSDWHSGVDFGAPCGTPVYASMSGVVTLSSGLFLSIKNNEGFVISYLHMVKSQRLVDVGDRVVPGQQIGYVGNVPPSTGCHLHFAVNVLSNTNSEVAKLPLGSGSPAYVDPEAFMRIFGTELCPAATCARTY